MKNFLLLLLVCLPLFAAAQPHRSCATMEHLEIQMQQDPGLEQRMQQLEQFTQEYIARHGHQRVNGDIITIPTVVHVVYRTSAENIPDAQIFSQMGVLNKDFRRLNTDAGNTRPIFLPVAADTEIEFCLATVDPEGNPTNGITRTKTSKRSFSYINDGVKFNSSGGKDAWPTDQYLNIWVCNLSNSILGYAQFPGGNASTDGVVVWYRAFGSSDDGSFSVLYAPYDKGRTATHEVGHWLNLRHIWGDGGCSVDDFVHDTPLAGNYNSGCNHGANSCNEGTGDLPDMVENYMDYSYDACMNIFTQGQSTRMNSIFNTDPRRNALLSSPGCGTVSTVCNVPGSLNTTNITDNSATLSWASVSGAANYDVQHRQVGAPSWNSANTTATSLNLGGLTTCTDYEWQVRSNCSESSSNYSGSATFSTTGCGGGGGGTCDAPQNVTITPSNGNNVIFSWDAVPAALQYELGTRQVGSSSWNTILTTNTSVVVGGVAPNRTYEYRLRSLCDGTTSAYVTGTFNRNGAISRETGSDLTFHIYPNPADNYLFVSIPYTLEGAMALQIFDITGRTVHTETGFYGSDGIIVIPTLHLQQGMYMVTVSDGTGTLYSERIVLAR